MAIASALDRQGVRIQEARLAGLAGVALLGEVHLDAHQLRFVGQYVNAAGVGHLDDVLVVPLAPAPVLFPARVRAEAQRADALGDQQIDAAP